jgi:hypothetical protein
MSKVLRTVMPVGVRGNTRIVVVPNSGVAAGELVEVLEPSGATTTYKVQSVAHKTLGGLKHADLAGFLLPDPAMFWSRYEATVGTGLPAETALDFVTVAPDWAEALEEALEEAEKPEAPPARKQRPKFTSSDDE